MKPPPLSDWRQTDFSKWYQEVIKAADLAEHSVSRGCMVIKPWGYGIWEIIQSRLDSLLKDSGHENAYFPLLIPLSLLEREADHVDGFAKECAVVTHSRLESDGSRLLPSSPLSEPYVIRPTSEAIIGATYSKWVNSYRDLPILVNQWANVFRWEMRTRLFVRTSEFLWQEGHTVHASRKEAMAETVAIHKLYEEFIGQELCLPILTGIKTPDERFPGAVETYTLEALMQDGKALQVGTSHFLGQNFSKAYQIKFKTQQGHEEYGWTTSWGVSTRLIGGLIMSLGDDYGLVLPPAVAPKQVVILVLTGKNHPSGEVVEYADQLKKRLSDLSLQSYPLRIRVDTRPIRGGEKKWQHIKRGVPLVVEIGAKEYAEQSVSYTHRLDPEVSVRGVGVSEFCDSVVGILAQIQQDIRQRSAQRLSEHTRSIEDLEDFADYFRQPRPGFASVPWCEGAIDHPLLSELKVSPRVIVGKASNNSRCLFTSGKATSQVIFARAY